MKNRIVRTATLTLNLLFGAAAISLAQEKSPSSSDAATADTLAQPADTKLTTHAQPNEADMKKMMEQMDGTRETGRKS